MESTEETRARAQAVLDYIHDNPERHEQGDWCSTKDSPDNMCGTTMCIAGTALFLHHGSLQWYFDGMGNFSERAGELLGLDWIERDVLFYQMNNEKAVQLLKKVVVGEDFSPEEMSILDD